MWCCGGRDSSASSPSSSSRAEFIVWGAMGDSAASLMTCEPLLLRPQWGAFGVAKQALSACFVNSKAIEAHMAETRAQESAVTGDGYPAARQERHAS